MIKSENRLRFLLLKTIRYLLIKNTAKPYVALLVSHLSFDLRVSWVWWGGDLAPVRPSPINGGCPPFSPTDKLPFGNFLPIQIPSSSLTKQKTDRQSSIRFRLVAGRGISSCFLQSNLRASPTNALQKSSVTAKTIDTYRFLTLLQIPSILLSKT